jgi:hypothetical protein
MKMEDTGATIDCCALEEDKPAALVPGHEAEGEYAVRDWTSAACTRALVEASRDGIGMRADHRAVKATKP